MDSTHISETLLELASRLHRDGDESATSGKTMRPDALIERFTGESLGKIVFKRDQVLIVVGMLQMALNGFPGY